MLHFCNLHNYLKIGIGPVTLSLSLMTQMKRRSVPLTLLKGGRPLFLIGCAARLTSPRALETPKTTAVILASGLGVFRKPIVKKVGSVDKQHKSRALETPAVSAETTTPFVPRSPLKKSKTSSSPNTAGKTFGTVRKASRIFRPGDLSGSGPERTIRWWTPANSTGEKSEWSLPKTSRERGLPSSSPEKPLPKTSVERPSSDSSTSHEKTTAQHRPWFRRRREATCSAWSFAICAEDNAIASLNRFRRASGGKLTQGLGQQSWQVGTRVERTGNPNSVRGGSSDPERYPEPTKRSTTIQHRFATR